MTPERSNEGSEERRSAAVESMKDFSGESFSEILNRWAANVRREVPPDFKDKTRYAIFYLAAPERAIDDALAAAIQRMGIEPTQTAEMKISENVGKALPNEAVLKLAARSAWAPDKPALIIVRGFKEHIAKLHSEGYEDSIARAAHDFNQEFGENHELQRAFPNRNKQIAVLVLIPMTGDEASEAAITSAASADFKSGMCVLES